MHAVSEEIGGNSICCLIVQLHRGMLILWGTGFGPANPAVPAGQVFSGANPLSNTVTVAIGGQNAQVDFAGVVGAGLVQINVHVPSSTNNGDAGVVASVGGVSTQTAGNMISVHN
jgi:uncharacterized protein (TIGR03437 family)